MAKKIFCIVSLAIIVVLTRLFFAEDRDVFFSVDTAHFALAVQDFSIAYDRPHLPGYFLHIKSISLLDNLTGSSHGSMLLLSVFYSVTASVLLFAFFLKFQINEELAVLLVLAVMTNPVVWLFGCVSESYSFDLFFSSALVLAGISGRWIYLTPVIFALASGVRQSSPVMLTPLYVYLWYLHFRQSKQAELKPYILSHIGMIVLILAWLVPMISSAGGLNEYIQLYKTNSPVPRTGIIKNFISFAAFSSFFVLPFIIGALFRFKKREDNTHFYKDSVADYMHVIIFWILPPILTFLLFHYSKGYYLICAGGVYALIYILIRNHKAKRLCLILIIIIQTGVFILYPYSEPSYELNYIPEKRTINQVEVLKQRFLSSFSMSAQHIRHINNDKESFDQELKEMLSFLKNNGKSIVFTDPSSRLQPVILQARYPEISFARLDFSLYDSYEVMHGISVMVMKNREVLYRHSIVISNKKFFGDYLHIFADKVMETGKYTIFTVKPGYENRMSGIYDCYFDKK